MNPFRLFSSLLLISVTGAAFGHGVAAVDPDPALTRLTAADPTIPAVDHNNRAAIEQLYQDYYLTQAAVPRDWSGSVTSCTVGSISSSYRAAVIGRINLYRVMAGLPGDVTLTSGTGTATILQAAALFFSANGTAAQQPNSTKDCFSQAALNGYQASTGAQNAVQDSTAPSGPAVVDAYVNDGFGVSQRSLMLFPPLQEMDYGEVPWNATSGSNGSAFYTAGSLGSRPGMPDGVAWPARGYMPLQMMPNYGIWSLALDGANFFGAQVTMTRDGQPVSVGYQTSAGSTSAGDPILYWFPAGVDENGLASALNGKDHVTYHVTITGISTLGGHAQVPSTVQYDVIMFDAAGAAVLPDAIFSSGFDAN